MFFWFNSEPRVSIFSLSPPSSLEDGGKRLLGVDLVFHLRRSISLLPVSYIPILCHCGHLFSQFCFSSLASFVPKDQAVFLSFWYWDYLLKTIFVQGLLRRVYQLILLLPKHSSIHFLNLENFLFGAW